MRIEINEEKYTAKIALIKSKICNRVKLCRDCKLYDFDRGCQNPQNPGRMVTYDTK